MKTRNLFALLAVASVVLFSCTKPDPGPDQGGNNDSGNGSQTEKPDSRLSDCTISDIAFEGQTTTPVITVNGTTGTITFKYDPTGLDLKAIKITKLSFRYEDPTLVPSASVSVGDALDLDKKTADIVVTSHDGKSTCTYTVSAESSITFEVENPFQGTISFDLIGGIPWGVGQSFLVFIGGPGNPETPSEADIRMTTDAEIGDGGHAHWKDPENASSKDGLSMTVAEQDNIISFKYTSGDSSTGVTYGTYVNDAGEDGEYSDFIYYASDQDRENKNIDVTEIYRLLPKGKMRWSQDYNSKTIKFYEFSDTNYENPVSFFDVEKAGVDSFVFPYVNYSLTQWMGPDEVAANKHCTIPVANYALHRHYEWHEWWVNSEAHAGEGWTETEGWSDTRYCVSCVRDIFWLVNISDAPAANHDDLLK